MATQSLPTIATQAPPSEEQLSVLKVFDECIRRVVRKLSAYLLRRERTGKLLAGLFSDMIDRTQTIL